LQILGSFFAAVVGWVTLEFVGRPFRNFFDLRGDVIRILTEYANVRARWKPIRDSVGAESGDMEELDLTYDEIARLELAVRDIRAIAARMRAFAVNETWARVAVYALGYDPHKASAGLIGLSNTFERYGEEKNFHKKRIAEALRIGDS